MEYLYVRKQASLLFRSKRPKQISQSSTITFLGFLGCNDNIVLYSGEVYVKTYQDDTYKKNKAGALLKQFFHQTVLAI